MTRTKTRKDTEMKTFNKNFALAAIREEGFAKAVKVDEPTLAHLNVFDNFTYQIKFSRMTNRIGKHYQLLFLPYGKLMGSDGGCYRVMSDVTVKEIMEYLNYVGRANRLEDLEDWTGEIE